jgi:hypothetical protein
MSQFQIATLSPLFQTRFQHLKLLQLTLNSLNFPWANRCISLDLWWNHAVEQQAFGRIFRIGQEKDTYMTRIVVKNSVDMRLLSMQLHKLQNLEKVHTPPFLHALFFSISRRILSFHCSIPVGTLMEGYCLAWILLT